jgi:hypothetical protein
MRRSQWHARGWRALLLAGVVGVLAGCASCNDPRAGIITGTRIEGDPPEMVYLRHQLSGAVASELMYPVESCRAGETGVVRVDLKIDMRTGALMAVERVGSSGHARLDAELERAWRAVGARGIRFALPSQYAGRDGAFTFRYAMNFRGR